MEIKRATSQSGVTYRIMDDGPMYMPIYTIEVQHIYDGFIWWDLEPSSPITTNRKGIEALFSSLINI